MSIPKNPALTAQGRGVKVPSTFVGCKLQEIAVVCDLFAMQAGQFPDSPTSLVTTFKQWALVIAQNEKLKQCTVQSLMGFAYTCAVNDFSPLPQDKEAYAVPYNRRIDDGQGGWRFILECQFQNGYGGIVKKIMRSGYVSSIDGYAVYECDIFRPVFGTEQRIIHEPNYMHDDYGNPTKVVAAYAVATMKDGGKKFKMLSRAEIERLRLKSTAQWEKGQKGGKLKAEMDGMWKEDYDSAAIIKALKKLGDTMSREVRRQVADEGQITRIEENASEPMIYNPELEFDDDLPKSITAGNSTAVPVQVPPVAVDESAQRQAELEAQLDRENGKLPLGK